MPSPDVRVRLSAEGVAEVVAALKKVQSEAVKASTTAGAAATKGASGIGSFTSALGGLKGLLGAAGLVASVAGVVSSIKSVGDQALQTADRLGDMAESVGTTPGKLSVLSNVAATSGLSIEQLGTVLGKTAKLTTDFENGSAEASATMRELGISLKDVKGKDTADRVALVAKRVSELRGSAEKTTAVIGALGEKLGPKAIPFLNELGSKGIEGARKELERLGLVLSDQVIANVKRLGDTSERSQSQIVALGSAFLSGASGPIVQGLEATQEALGTTTELWKGLGEVIGFVTRTVILLATALLPVLNLFDGLGTLLGNGIILIDSFFRQASLRSKGRFEEAKAQAKLVEEVIQRNIDAAAKRAQARMEIAGKALKGLFAGVTGATPASSGEELVDAEELKRQQRELRVALLGLDRSLYEARLKLADEADRRAFERGELNLREYYARRIQFIRTALRAELEFIERQRRLDLQKSANPREAAGINARARIQSLIAREQSEGQTDSLKADFESRKLALSQAMLDTRREALSVLGREREIQGDILRLETAQREAALQALGASAEDIQRLSTENSTSKTLANDFANAAQDASRALSTLQQDRAEVQARISAGLLGEATGARQLLALDEARLPKLRELAAALSSIAKESGNPEFIEKAREFSLNIDQIGLSIRAAGDALATFRADFENAFQSGLSSFLGSAINQVHSLEDAFRQLASSIIADIQRISAQKLSGSITQLLFGGGFGLTKSQKDLISITSGLNFATGGFVSGPGTGTSDSVPANLSNGEFVVRASVVDRPGVREALTNLNFGHRYDLTPPSFAPIQFDHGDFGEGGGTLTVNLGDGLKASDVQSSGNLKILVKQVSENRRLFRRILGSD